MTSSDSSATRLPRQGAFIFIFITIALDMVALGIIVPVLPNLVVEFEGGNVSSASRWQLIFGFTWAAMQFVFSPLLGAASDRFGRRPIILLSIFGLGLDYILMALAPNLWWLLIGRILSGVTASTYPTAAAYVADVTPPDERAGKFGMLGAAFGIGFVIGPAIGGHLGDIDLRLPFWIAAALSLANAAYGFFVLPESLPREKRGPVDWGKANPFGSLALLRSHPELFSLAGASFLMALAHEALPNVFVLYAGYRYEWDVKTVGTALALVGVCSGIVQGGLVRPLVKRLGERTCMYLGLACGFVGFVLIGAAHAAWIFMLGIPFIALWGLAGPSMQSLMSRRVSGTEQGQLQGAMGSIRGIAGMIGPIVMLGTFSYTAGPDAWTELPGLVYFLAAGLVTTTAWVAWSSLRSRLAHALADR